MRRAAESAALKPGHDPHEPFLGPGEVTAIDGTVIHVRLPDGSSAIAALALAYPYEPAVGDVLLVIGKDAGHYVIGVLHGTGRASLTFHGDVDLRAIGGAIGLHADKGVEIDAPELVVRARRLLTIADSVVERLGSLYQRVTSLARLHAGEVSTVADETASTQAKSAVITADEAVTVNGKQVLLG